MRSRTVARVAALALAGIASTATAQDSPVLRDRAMPHYRIGLEHMHLEEWAKAAAAFRAAIEIDPDFEMAHYGLGRAHMGQKHFEDAVAALTRCRDLYAAHSGRRFTNAQETQRYRRDQMIEIDEIIRQYQSVPQTFRTQEAVRQLNERKRQLQETINRGTNMTLENTVPAYVSLSLGSAYFRSGKMLDAEREYKATIAADPKTGEAHQNLAVVYLETGRVTDAERAIAAAKKVGFRVNPMLEQDIQSRKKTGS